VRRVSANASRARQATSRRKELQKIKLDQIRPSSRQHPCIRFERRTKLCHSAVSVQGVAFRYPGSELQVLRKVSFNVRAGEWVAIIGANGVGKTTLMRCLVGKLKLTKAKVLLMDERTNHMDMETIESLQTALEL